MTLPRQTVDLLYCFAGYIGSIVAFGLLYHRLYLKVPNRFLFAQDIASTQRSTVRETKTARLAQAAFARSALMEARPIIGSDAASITSGFYRVATLTTPAGATLRLVALTGPPAGGIRGVVFTYVDVTGHEHDFGAIDGKVPPRNMQEFEALIAMRVAQLESEEANLKKFLAGLDNSTSTLWNIMDFVYFSTITQTTVGYGDILPNSSLIRLLVATQILIGYALLVVAVNVVLLR
jgi:hypothetical protein